MNTAKEKFFKKDFFTIDPTKVPFYNMNGIIVGIVNISIDITDKKQKGKELTLEKNRVEHVTKVKTEFLHPFKQALLAEDSGADLECPNNHESSELSKNEPNSEINTLSFGRILLVEDHIMTAQINKAILSDLNYQIDIANNGETAISLTEKNHYDIIFMDIGLPDIDGYMVTQKIRSGEKNKFVPIIGLTAHVGIEKKQYCIDIGMNTVFFKPLTKEKMEDIVDSFVPKHRC